MSVLSQGFASLSRAVHFTEGRQWARLLLLDGGVGEVHLQVIQAVGTVLSTGEAAKP